MEEFTAAASSMEALLAEEEEEEEEVGAAAFGFGRWSVEKEEEVPLKLLLHPPPPPPPPPQPWQLLLALGLPKPLMEDTPPLLLCLKMDDDEPAVFAFVALAVDDEVIEDEAIEEAGRFTRRS
jgi:hypothetical protein